MCFIPFSGPRQISSDMGMDNKLILQHITQQENGALYPLPLSSSSSTSSEITESFPNHGFGQEQFAHHSKMSTTSTSSDASLSSNDNSTAIKHKQNMPLSIQQTPVEVNSNSQKTIKTDNLTSFKENTANQMMPTSIGDSIFSQSIAGTKIMIKSVTMKVIIYFMICQQIDF